MSEDGVREIQLNGKQLVFLFMSAVVVAVVVFLCGVMVGRGVREPRLAASAPDGVVDPTAAVDRPAAAVLSSNRPPVTTQEMLTYAERLEAPVPVPETLKDPVEPVATAPPEPLPDTPGEAPAAAAEASFAEPAGNGYAVQVGAYPRRTADVIARGLAAKGFPSFITPRERGLFAVRVGKYSDRREAEAVMRRLERDEQFNRPWLTR